MPTTCWVEDNPPDTENRQAVTKTEAEEIAGWIMTQPRYPSGWLHVSACKDGVVHLVGFLEGVQNCLVALANWHQKNRGNVDEWMQDGV